MFDKFRLKDVLAHYKQNFVSTQWGNEKYKWEAVKWFQDNWDVNAQNFPEMLSRSLDKTFNLLASINNFPRRMIVSFSKAAPEEVRAMFIALFDENKDVYERMNAFKLQASILLERYGNGAAQHYQYENAISTYLWLRYPDKYYIYKFGEVKNVANELETDYRFKKGAYADNIRNFLRLYNEISLALKEDTELVNLFQSQLTDTCYVSGELFEQYIHDMKIVQHFAMLNRQAMMDEIVKGMKLHVEEQFTTIHNYIDTDAMILRKGAVSAKAGEQLLIPINMRDGSLLCVGKGNEDWNCSAPHGAGRLMSRADAKQSFTVSEFKKQMAEVYTTSVSKATLDECPMAYKGMQDILDNIGPTADVVKVIRPIYNFKAGDEE